MTGVPMGKGKMSETTEASGFFPRELTSQTFLMFFPNVHPDRHSPLTTWIPVQPRLSRLGYPGEEIHPPCQPQPDEHLIKMLLPEMAEGIKS